MKNESSDNKTNPIVDIFAKHNLIIFIVIIVGGLVASILILKGIMDASLSPSKVISTSEMITFDEATSVSIDKLKTSSDNVVDQPIPSGRINLFSE